MQADYQYTSWRHHGDRKCIVGTHEDKYEAKSRNILISIASYFHKSWTTSEIAAEERSITMEPFNQRTTGREVVERFRERIAGNISTRRCSYRTQT